MKFEDFILVKLGGNIIGNQNNLISSISQLRKLVNVQALFRKVIIICGGGEYANFIRILDQEISLGDDISHWASIIAMDINAKKIHYQFPEIRLISKFELLKNELENKESSGKLLLFQPYNFLREKDDLPHSWNVTSDSIALFMTNALKLSHCVLVKDVDGILDKNYQLIKNLSIKDYKAMKEGNLLANLQKYQPLKEISKPIDPFTLELIKKYHLICILLNGTPPYERILEYFHPSSSEKEKRYTRITD
ncbi:MAG: hypothetical protein BAJALOKI3v1_630021 [Promethearchaeota archaeon]|nr:MAG: hypothetical protein BAJALOKI3v1_630021 [Candidatus Lokiarchaeota archaeon]